MTPDVPVKGMWMTLSMILQLMLIMSTDGTVISQPVVAADEDRHTCKQ